MQIWDFAIQMNNALVRVICDGWIQRNVTARNRSVPSSLCRKASHTWLMG